MSVRHSDTNLDIFTEALSLLMSWRTNRPFDTRVRFRLGLVSEQKVVVLLRANPRKLTYELSSENGVVEQRYDGFAHTIDYRTGTETLPTGRQDLPVEAINSEAVPARLAFPMALPVWGDISSIVSPVKPTKQETRSSSGFSTPPIPS